MMIKKFLTIFTILIFISTTLLSQLKDDYTKNWKKVAAFDKTGLPKSALQEVLVIYNLAIKDNNDAQQIKAGMYQVRYRNMIEEDSEEVAEEVKEASPKSEEKKEKKDTKKGGKKEKETEEAAPRRTRPKK